MIPPGFHESLATFPRINLVKEIDAFFKNDNQIDKTSINRINLWRALIRRTTNIKII